MKQLTRRAYQGEEDYWRVRDFLRRVYLLNGRREISWPVCRWDYWRWHVYENCVELDLPGVVYLWEDKYDEIAAVLNPEVPGQAYFHYHPSHWNKQLQEEMLQTAEERILVEKDGVRKLFIWLNQFDIQMQELVEASGFEKTEHEEHNHLRSLDLPIPDCQPAEGYTVRSLGGREDLPGRSWLSWRAFHPNDPDEDYDGWEWYLNIQRAPLYRRDLDIVAQAPDGELASFCTLWFDDVTRSGICEPVGTSPEHQRKGVASAVMTEGLRRLKHLGATQAHVGSGTPQADALYRSMGFEYIEINQAWRKLS